MTTTDSAQSKEQSPTSKDTRSVSKRDASTASDMANGAWRDKDSAWREELDSALRNPADKKIFISLLDCGGQLSFSVCQTISFNADESIFVLAFNSSIALKERIPSMFRQNSKCIPLPVSSLTNQDHIAMWLSTIATIRAPSKPKPVVVVVGTFCNSSVDFSTSELGMLLKEFKDQVDIRGPFYVDNSEPRGQYMRFFRQTMADLIRDKVDRATQDIPLSYLRCEWCIREYKTNHYQTVSEFGEFAEDVAGIPQVELPTLLQYLHNHCAVRFFSKSEPAERDAIVYLNVPWLLEQVCKLLACTMEEVPSRCSLDQREDIELLKTKGILTTRLADYLWSKSERDTRFRKDLLDILHQLALQCPVPSEAGQAVFNISADAGPFYYVPICIQKEQCGLSKRFSDAEVIPPFVFRTATQFFPLGEFSRLLVRLLQHYKPPITNLEIGMFCLRFHLTGGVTQCYIAEVTHAQQGVAIALKCSRPEVAAGSANDGFPMAKCATSFRKTMQQCVESVRKEGYFELAWKASFFCTEHEGMGESCGIAKLQNASTTLG